MNPSASVGYSIDNQQGYQQKLHGILSQKSTGNFGLNKSTSNLFRHRLKEPSQKVDLSHFNQVVTVDSGEETAEIEGMTTYERLVDELLPHGFMPPVVPELKTITIGGALTGIGIESSSFKFGLVHETVLEIDVLTSSGEVIHCTPDNEHSDLFYGFPNSYGTLGYALKVKIRLQPIRPYVHLRHARYHNAGPYFRELGKICDQKDDFDFVDGTIFSPQEMYITTGNFADTAPSVSDYTYMDIYYKSIRKKGEDYLTTKDYIWRWDTDWFWCSKHFGAQIPLVRKFFGVERLRSTTYWKIRDYCSRKGITAFMEKLSRKKEAVIQDVEIPVDYAEHFLDFFQQVIKISPVWVCPTRALDSAAEYPLYAMDPQKLYINFGFWDVVPSSRPKGYLNRKIEAAVEEFKGKKSLYSDSYYAEEHFWKLYNKDAYEHLKRSYDPDARFKDLYTKCVKRQ